MPDNKKHHYVPRFYLKRFSHDKKSICLYNLKRELKVCRANLKSQCYSDYFYGKSNMVEQHLAKMEGEISLLFKAIDRRGTLPPPFSDEHIAFVIFILIQYGRTKYSSDAMDEMNDKIMKRLFRDQIEAEIENINLDDYTIGIKEAANYSMGLSAQLFPALLDLGYKLIVNLTPVEFVTSDNPVVLHNQLLSYRRFGSNTGLSTKGLQIFFPISPERLAVFYDLDVYRMGSDRKVVIEVTNKQDVYHLNALQGCSCYENIYFRNDKQNLKALHRKVRPFLRKNKANLDIIPEHDNGKTELLINYREDVRFNLNLTFLSIRRSVKRWQAEFRKLQHQPVILTRNAEYEGIVKEFADKLRKGELKPEEFLSFMKQKAKFEKI